MWRLGPDDEATLARAWRAARPFPHLIFDDVLPPAQLAEVLELLEEEPVERAQSDLFDFEATSPEPQTEAFRQLRDRFAASLAPRLGRITGKHVSRVDMRAYAYRPGHYLLPHTDHQDGLARALAYAFYLPSPEPPQGGELELFACREHAGELTSTDPTPAIEPRRNRLVVFDVSAVSLHQVCEVLTGLRISLAGWFYP